MEALMPPEVTDVIKGIVRYDGRVFPGEAWWVGNELHVREYGTGPDDIVVRGLHTATIKFMGDRDELTVSGCHRRTPWVH